MTILRPILAVFAGLLLLGAAHADELPNFGPNGYYELRPDLRKCVSPLCGGFWLKRVNHPMTQCPDHKPRRECYVAELENAPQTLWEGDEPIVVRGRIHPREYEGFGNLGYFDVMGAWRAATRAPGGGQYGGVENSGIVCITTPCESWDLYVLNKPINRLLTGIDLRAVGAPPELEQKAIGVIADGGVLLVRGITRKLETNPGLEFEAKQFYLPMR
jgi:hypothetical protein